MIRDPLPKAMVLIAGLAMTPPAQANEGGETRLYVENDFFDFFGENSDRYYTQGMRLDVPDKQQRLTSDFLPWLSHDEWCKVVCSPKAEGAVFQAGYAIGQNMYTPERITVASPQPNDRPWAGLLYLSRFASIGYQVGNLVQRQDRVEATLGIVGPPSLAGPTQRLWHDIGGWDYPAGWENQLKTEPVLQLQYATARRLTPQTEGSPVDVIPRLRLNAGNALVSAEAEVTARLGWNLSGFGVPTIPLAPPPAANTGTKRWFRSANVFARASVKAVAHNLFLDGNTFADNDIRIRRTPFVTEFAVGAEANIRDGFWLSYQYVHRGSEFEIRRGIEASAQMFGSLTIAWKQGL